VKEFYRRLGHSMTMPECSVQRDITLDERASVDIGGFEYLIGREVIGSIISHEIVGQSDSPIPAIVCRSRNVAKDANLLSEIDEMISEDDVLIAEFTLNIICYVGRKISQSERIDKHGDPMTFYQTQNFLVPGPYFIKDNNVHRASRLYLDDHSAFSSGVELEEGYEEPER
jgi:hypothetical protein